MLTTVLGVAHGLASALAMIVGAVVLLGGKGTARHRQLGQIYVIAMAVLCVTSLGIYRLDQFRFPHWFALATIAAVLIAWCAARFRLPTRASWRYAHMTAMLISYYFLLGGAINEAFLHIPMLHDLPRAVYWRSIRLSHAMLMQAAFIWVACANAYHMGRNSRAVTP